jgi:FtsP/CotA-like multicopper oxidase with cupredoxin domain
LQLRDSSGLQLQFTTPSYLTGAAKLPYAFGPTLRLKAGQSLRIQLANDLLQTGSITAGQPHAFAGPMDTNLHTHGLWDPNGKCAALHCTVY